MMKFADTEKIDVTKHIEKKGRFSYLSWPFAVSEFRKACPNGRWDIRHFNNSGNDSTLLKQDPFCVTGGGCFVEVTVIPDVAVKGVSFTQIHPILDNKNKPIPSPNAFQINTSIQRCLVKAIALATGIGLHIYAGEDLPPSDEPEAEQHESKLPEYIDRVDNFESHFEADNWAKKHKDEISKDLSKTELVSFRKHFKGVRDALSAAYSKKTKQEK